MLPRFKFTFRSRRGVGRARAEATWLWGSLPRFEGEFPPCWSRVTRASSFLRVHTTHFAVLLGQKCGDRKVAGLTFSSAGLPSLNPLLGKEGSFDQTASPRQIAPVNAEGGSRHCAMSATRHDCMQCGLGRLGALVERDQVGDPMALGRIIY